MRLCASIGIDIGIDLLAKQVLVLVLGIDLKHSGVLVLVLGIDLGPLEVLVLTFYKLVLLTSVLSVLCSMFSLAMINVVLVVNSIMSKGGEVNPVVVLASSFQASQHLLFCILDFHCVN